MLLLLLRIAVLLVGTGIASVQDAKTGLISDKITYSMILLGIIFNLLEFDLSLFSIAIIVFLIGFALYYLGKIGGGDVKLFTAIALLLPFYKGQIFILNLFFVAALLSIVFYGCFFVLRYLRSGINLKENKQGIIKSVFLGIIIAAYFVLLFQTGLMNPSAMLILLIPICFALLFIAFEQGIRKQFFLKHISVEKLEEDEIVAVEHLNESTKKELDLKIKGILGEKEVEKLKKFGIKKVPVYRELPPFAPFVFLGIIIALLQPDLLGFLFT